MIGTGTVDSVKELMLRLGYVRVTVTEKLRLLGELGLVRLKSPENQCLVPTLRYSRIKLVLPFASGATALSKPLRLGVSSSTEERTPGNVDRILNSMREFCTVTFLNDRNLEFLSLIATGQPNSILALAERTERDPRNTYPATRKLVRAGLIKLEGPQPLRPVLNFDGVTLTLELAPVPHSGK